MEWTADWGPQRAAARDGTAPARTQGGLIQCVGRALGACRSD